MDAIYRTGLRVLFLILLLCAISESSRGAISGLQRVATSLADPMFATNAPGEPEKLYIAQRGIPQGGNNGNSTANIHALNLTTGVTNPTPFLSIPGLNVSGEGGLLGLAFHPDYAANGKFYVYVTANDSVAGTPFSSYIREYTRSSSDPNLANPTFRNILQFTQPQDNHNGGWIGFSPNDGYLYIASGDGGNGNDQGTGHTEPGGNAQDITSNFLGKMLRVDVDRDDFTTDNARNYGIPYDTSESPGNPFAPTTLGSTDPTGDNEIWAYGLRNPFRASFDRITGDLWIGDVGQGAREEIDFQLGTSEGGENYGWRLREGTIQTPGSVGGPAPMGVTLTEPIYDYRRPGASGVDPNLTGTTVIGGYAYRGPDPELQGLYFFADTGTNRIWTLKRPSGTGSPEVTYINPPRTPTGVNPNTPVSFGEDALGNLYVVYLSGSVYRITTNALVDGDYNADGDVNQADYDLWVANFGSTTTLGADGNVNGVVDAADYTVWQDNLGRSSRDAPAGTGSGVPEPEHMVLVGQGIVLAWFLSRCYTKRETN